MFSLYVHMAASPYLFDWTFATVGSTFKTAAGNLFLAILAFTAVYLMLKRHIMLALETVAAAVVIALFIYVPGFFQNAATGLAALVGG